MHKLIVAAAALAASAGWALPASAQSAERTLGGLISAAQAQGADAVKRTPLQKIDFPGDKHTTLLVLVEIAPGGTVARHTHPGIETGYVIEGEGVLSVEGQPDLPLKPGASYLVPPGVPHMAKNGDKPQKIIAAFAVEKDKPLATPAP